MQATAIGLPLHKTLSHLIPGTCVENARFLRAMLQNTPLLEGHDEVLAALKIRANEFSIYQPVWGELYEEVFAQKEKAKLLTSVTTYSKETALMELFKKMHDEAVESFPTELPSAMPNVGDRKTLGGHYARMNKLLHAAQKIFLSQTDEERRKAISDLG
jgi:hypothetical protein